MSPRLEAPPPNLSFGQLLNWFLDQGIRPSGAEDQTKKWGKEDFAHKIGKSGRAVNYWLKNQHPPESCADIERVLFGMNQREYTEYRSRLRDAWRSLKENRSAFGQYGRKSSVELIWRNIFEDHLDEISHQYDLDAENLKDLMWMISAVDKTISPEDARSKAQAARSSVFDQKYGAWKIEDDERYVMGIEAWTEEFLSILDDLVVKFDSSLLCVGVGCGFEGVDIYDRFAKFIGVDISKNAIEQAKGAFPDSLLLHGQAEYLPEVAKEIDVYVSLKTYQSSFFDIGEAIHSCSIALKPGGVAIISVPRGYFYGGKFVPGIARTNYNLLSAQQHGTYRITDKLYPFNLIQKIVRQLYRRMFIDVTIRTGMVEHYICARKQ